MTTSSPDPARADRPFLGRGWSFPPEFTRALPGVRMLEQEEDIVSSLHVLLTTVPGERIMLPDYGCSLDPLMFETLDTRTRTLVADTIRAAILLFEPRIDLEEVRIDESPQDIQEGRVRIAVVFRVRATNSRRNVVFPFYRDEATDVDLEPETTVLPEQS
ncbi:GPW/gp25 family protein [Brachybacterium vulturis]|uniref:GPW/gp25 family protein n=1 Tax=Brachybacterium vulturis TaxID=2017484 RepID=UPI003736A889